MLHGLLQAIPGPTGGLGLKKKSMDISIFDIVSAMEGDIKLAPCKDNAEPCPREKRCFTHPLWESMQDEMILKLKLLSLDSLHPVN
jgi:Rrf2 family protein